MRSRLIPLLMLAAACAEPTPAEPPRAAATRESAALTSQSLWVYGPGPVGRYDGGTAIELVSPDGGAAIIGAWSGPGPNAAVTAISTDMARGTSELIAAGSGSGPFLPLTFWIGGAERARFELTGGLRLTPETSGPRGQCSEDRRGVLWFDQDDVQGDVLWVCLRKYGRYRWVGAAQ